MSFSCPHAIRCAQIISLQLDDVAPAGGFQHGLFRKPCVLDVFYVDNIIYNRENNFNLCIVCRPNSALLPPENSSCQPALGYGLAEGFSPVFLRRSSYYRTFDAAKLLNILQSTKYFHQLF